jgi:hypothetical protein
MLQTIASTPARKDFLYSIKGIFRPMIDHLVSPEFLHESVIVVEAGINSKPSALVATLLRQPALMIAHKRLTGIIATLDNGHWTPQY